MAVSEQTPYIEYVANGVTTSFPLGFDCDKKEHLVVKIDDVTVNTVNFSLLDGVVIFNTAPISNAKITFQRDTPLERNTEYQSFNNSFRPQPLNGDFDRIWWKLQELWVQVILLWSALKKEIKDRIESDLEIRSWVSVLLNNIVDNGLVSAIAVTTVESIVDLQNLLKWDGRTIYVKSFHVGLNKGGGTFVYDAEKITANDGVMIFYGWVRLSDESNINVVWAGAKGDGVSNDTLAFNITKNAAIKNGLSVFIPAPKDSYLITNTIIIDEKVSFCGDAGLMVDLWAGKTVQGGSRVKYTGTGAAFQINPILNPSPTQRRAYGVMFKNLIIEGTPAASDAIKVSDKSNINVTGADLAAFTIDNVYLINFKYGRGLNINFCFMNKINNLFTGDCAVGCTLNYAHNTTFTGGSFQQGLLGLDVLHSYDVTLHGTCLQGHYADRAALLGLQMPRDFFVWDGWDGAGADNVLRTHPDHYSGSGCRVFGSILNWFGGYEEHNNIGYITEPGSKLGLFGKYVDLDAAIKYWVQVGIGSLTVASPSFAQGQYVGLNGVIHVERNYAAPINITSPDFPPSLPENKHYTGRIASSMGISDDVKPLKFRYIRNMYNTDVNIGGVISHQGSIATSGFNREYSETIIPASTISKTIDLSSGTVGTNFLHVTNGINLTIEFTDLARMQSGISMKIAIINNHDNVDSIIYPSANFKFGAASYILQPKKQRILEFYFANGYWLEKGVNLPL